MQIQCNLYEKKGLKPITVVCVGRMTWRDYYDNHSVPLRQDGYRNSLISEMDLTDEDMVNCLEGGVFRIDGELKPQDYIEMNTPYRWTDEGRAGLSLSRYGSWQKISDDEAVPNQTDPS